jgi:hypothetical protein
LRRLEVNVPGLVDLNAPTRDLLRILRVPPETRERLPETVCWRVYLELRRRGEPQADGCFVNGLRALHRRRGIGSGTLPLEDPDVEDHKLADDPYVGELWRSYKRALCANRTGPAGQILREFEQQLRAG